MIQTLLTRRWSDNLGVLLNMEWGDGVFLCVFLRVIKNSLLCGEMFNSV